MLQFVIVSESVIRYLNANGHIPLTPVIMALPQLKFMKKAKGIDYV